MTLNMAVPAGQKVLAGLIEKADVVIDNFKLGTLPKWGFTDAWFEAHAPRAVRCSITGYGSSGPKAALPGYDFVLQAESGLMSICGEPEGTPTKYGVAIVDVCTGHAGLQCHSRRAQCAPRHRARPEGRAVAVRDLAAHADQRRLQRAGRGQGGGRFGNGHPSLVPYTTYHASDAMMALAVGNEPQFAKCAAVLGHPEWADDPALQLQSRPGGEPHPGRRRRSREALAGDTADAWIAKLKAVGVPCGRINSVAEALADPQTAARAHDRDGAASRRSAS